MAEREKWRFVARFARYLLWERVPCSGPVDRRIVTYEDFWVRRG